MTIFSIYRVSNQVNGKVYIGVTSKSPEKRLSVHLDDTKRGSILPFHNALRKYGIDCFKLSVLAQTTDEHDGYWLEKFFIAEYKSFPPTLGFGYNMAEGGRPKSIGQPSSDAKSRMSAGKKGKPVSSLTREKMKKAWKNRKLLPHSGFSEKERERRRFVMLGNKFGRFVLASGRS